MVGHRQFDLQGPLAAHGPLCSPTGALWAVSNVGPIFAGLAYAAPSLRRPCPRITPGRLRPIRRFAWARPVGNAARRGRCTSAGVARALRLEKPEVARPPWCRPCAPARRRVRRQYRSTQKSRRSGSGTAVPSAIDPGKSSRPPPGAPASVRESRSVRHGAPAAGPLPYRRADGRRDKIGRAIGVPVTPFADGHERAPPGTRHAP